MQHLPGTILIVLDADCRPAGEVIVENYIYGEKAYRVWWTYEQTEEREMIKVPEWRLQKKKTFNT